MTDKPPTRQVMGPTIELAARVKRALEGEALDVNTTYGTFYVSQVTLSYSDGHEHEVVGFLTPDEGDGRTYDFYAPGPA